MTIELKLASESDQPTVREMLEEYLQEMFAIQNLTANEIAALGAYPWFDHYWAETDRLPYLILHDRMQTGFALIRLGKTNRIAEFFIKPEYRGKDIGGRAAKAILANHPGNWEIAVMEENKPAERFWRKVVSDFQNGNFTERWSDNRPRGPSFEFCNDI